MTIPTESTFTTSSYVNVPPIDTLPEKVPVVPDTAPENVPVVPDTAPVKAPVVAFKVVNVWIPICGCDSFSSLHSIFHDNPSDHVCYRIS